MENEKQDESKQPEAVSKTGKKVYSVKGRTEEKKQPGNLKMTVTAHENVKQGEMAKTIKIATTVREEANKELPTKTTYMVKVAEEGTEEEEPSAS